MLYEMLEPDFVCGDERGCLTQLVREGYSQFNVITTKAGVQRGGHFHKLNVEAFYIVSGSVSVRFSNNKETTGRQFLAGDFFRVSPYITHWFYFEEDTVLVSMYSNGVEMPDGLKDIYSAK